ncbi:MAG: SH3 domain-containing protein [Leptospira sp.]|nr:SH3 domain-containing protein [Leptospira sp.]NCS92364.1 SH3 domain-containing protein [Leptospira sp.]
MNCRESNIHLTNPEQIPSYSQPQDRKIIDKKITNFKAMERFPHLGALSSIGNSINDPCKFFYEYLGLTIKPKIKTYKNTKYCDFNYHGMKMKVDFPLNEEASSGFVSLDIHLDHLKKKKYYSFRIKNGKLLWINSGVHCYSYGVWTDKIVIGPSWQYVPCGASKGLNIDTGKGGELYCYNNSYDGKKSNLLDGGNQLGMECGSKYRIVGNTEIIEKNDNIFEGNLVCRNQCFDFLPFMMKGSYLIRKSNVILRSKPTSSSKAIAVYNIDDKLEVLKDIGNLEEIAFQVAPWVEVVMFDGKKGYLFGGLLKQKGELLPEELPNNRP